MQITLLSAQLIRARQISALKIGELKRNQSYCFRYPELQSEQALDACFSQSSQFILYEGSLGVSIGVAAELVLGLGAELVH